MPNEPCDGYECITTERRRELEDEIARLREELAGLRASSVSVEDYCTDKAEMEALRRDSVALRGALAFLKVYQRCPPKFNEETCAAGDSCEACWERYLARRGEKAREDAFMVFSKAPQPACDSIRTQLAEAEKQRDEYKVELDAQLIKAVDAAHEYETVCAQLAEANAELDLNTKLLAQQNAACAAMREALEAYRHSYWLEADHKAGLHAIQVTSKTMELADAALSSSAGKDMLERIKGMEDVLQDATEAPHEMEEMMRREGFAIDNLDDRWQKLAFTLYTRIVTIAAEARAYLSKEGK